MAVSSFHLEVEHPQGAQTILVPREDREKRLADLLRRKSLPLNTRCGQRGLCDGCVVELVGGSVLHVASGKEIASDGQAIAIRGCEHRPGKGKAAKLRIPPRSLLAYQPQVVSEFRINVPRAHDPLWQRLEIARGELPQGKALVDELCHLIARRWDRRRPVRFEPAVAGKLNEITHGPRLYVTLECRGDQWLVTGVSNEPGARGLGVAIDIGTTTVALLLVDMGRGEIVSKAAAFNHQMHLGDDVLTRINLCITDKAMIHQLQDEVVNQTIRGLLEEALRKAGASAGQLACFTMAGNSTMLHLLAGVDPSTMGLAPFTPVFLEHRVMPSEAIRLKPLNGAVADDPTIHLLPACAAYIGADLTGGIFSSGLIYDQGPSILVDVGTNGEIIVKHGDRLLGCATAAGPAFEGARLTSGIRAGEGAISHIRFTPEPFAVEIEVIGDTEPMGICGSAYVDFLAEARRIGLISRTGRFDRAALPGAAERFVEHEDFGLGFRIAHGQGRREIVVSELDISRLLPAKAAIAAGMLTLLELIHMTPAQVKRLYLAGGFGMHLNVANAIGCGMLPGFHVEQVQLVGNTSLAGAYLALLDSGVLHELTRISKRLEVIELNLDPGFEGRYIDELALPEPAAAA
jgi:uncharacterized 2Fe-2S/4Fe-4S cluster protein (DUF4445 family)